MDNPVRWTIDQLVELVGTALSSDYRGAASGRVRDLPDRRAVRWYTTIGLVDRPSVMRGRTALYGPRQLLQVVAIKRRQAAGRSLAQIQQELAGANDETLRDVAHLPPAILDTVGAPPWSPTDAEPGVPVRERFWIGSAEASTPVAPDGTDPVVTAAGHRDAGSDTGAVHGLRLPGGLTLMLPAGAAAPTSDDRAAARAAAQPLIDTLEARGLIQTDRCGEMR